LFILLLKIGSVVTYCEGNEPSGSRRHGEFFDISEHLLASQVILHYMRGGGVRKKKVKVSL
jgi:hypothetical protein